MKRTMFGLLLAILLCGCGMQTAPIEKKEKLQVVTSFYPMYLLSQMVTEGATGLELTNMAQPKTGCLHEYQLTISDMKLLEKADVLIINGGGMEAFLEQAVERYPELIVIDASAGILFLEETPHYHTGSGLHHESEHEHNGNPHIWLSLERAFAQAENIAEALEKLDAADADVFTKNLNQFRKGIQGLLQKAHRIGIPTGEYVAVFHEGFDYIAEMFGMKKGFEIVVDEHQMPSAKEMAAAVEESKYHEIQFFFAAADQGEHYAKAIAAEMGKKPILLDPLTMADKEGFSYLERMEHTIDAIETHWQEGLK